MMHLKGFEKFSLLDYDNKVSAVFFFAGCNMRCPFCHNADIVLNPNSTPDLDINEAMEYLKNRKGLIDAVVVSGGEPTLLPELLSLLRDIKELGYEIKLDTNGTNPKVLKDIMDEDLVDYFAMDIKNSFKKYSLTSGKNINIHDIQDSIHLIMSSGKDYEFRTTLVKEFHERMDYDTFLSLIKGAKRLFLQKFVDREGCIKKGLHEVSIEEAEKLRDYLAKGIPEVTLRGY